MPDDIDSTAPPSRHLTSAADLDMEIIEHRGEPVLTLQMINKAHQRPEGTAGRNFREHRGRFIQGEDFHQIDQPDEIRRLGFQRPQGGTPNKVVLLTESGYLMLVKSFTDDLAWTVQRRLVKSYFRRAVPTLPAIPQDYVAALRLAADATEEAQEAKAALALAAPKTEFYDRFVSADGLYGLQNAARVLNQPPNKFIRELKQQYLFYQGGSLVPYRPYVERGLFEVRSEIVDDKPRSRTWMTPKGVQFFARKLGVSEHVEG